MNAPVSPRDDLRALEGYHSPQLDVSVRPVLMFVTVISSAALLTPVATPANLMVMGPGGYRFGDYAKLGLPLLAWYFVVSVGLVPLFWSF